jgi:hypothetical protein
MNANLVMAVIVLIAVLGFVVLAIQLWMPGSNWSYLTKGTSSSKYDRGIWLIFFLLIVAAAVAARVTHII